jgi:1,4-dihydroxy-6-naphthoate synthase
LTKRTITVGHSPDADDAFMFYALAKEKIDTGNLHFEHILQDIETLNRRAENEELDLTALSVHGYTRVHHSYAILSCGASIGDKYGPIVVSRQPDKSIHDFKGKVIAIPGTRTTAFLTLKLCMADFRPLEVDFDRILDVVKSGEAEAGLVIHEGQVTYREEGLHLVTDLGVWWAEITDGLPLPLGVNGIRKSLGSELIREIHGYLKQSILYALENRKEALDYALSFGRGLAREKANRFVGMYVNEFTVDMGERGEKGIRELLHRGADAGMVPAGLEAEIIR